MVLAVAAHATDGLVLTESFVVDGDSAVREPLEVLDAHGSRMHRIDADAGSLRIEYQATVSGRGAGLAAESAELIRYVRPSRYCESDTLAAIVEAEFEGLEGKNLLDAVSSWVGTHLEYTPGSSLPTDGAVQTLLSRKGVCRDFAHLTVAFLRANGVPARCVSVYAPGLEPMDFHAVCEAWVDGQWLVVDPTSLAPRQSMVRIATGRDAADTAFLTVLSGHAELIGVDVSATVDSFPTDDARATVRLG